MSTPLPAEFAELSSLQSHVGSNRLAHRVALVTGATSGIGCASVALFCREGAKVAFTGRRSDKGKALEAELKAQGFEALFIEADHTKKTDCERSVEMTVKTFGRLDILFNNAGIVTKGTAESSTEDDWAATLALNVTAVWCMSALALPHMRKVGKGAIVNNASDWGLVGARNALPYATSKGAVVQMTRSMALDHAHEKIRVNAVCPGDTFVERWTAQGYFEGEPVPVSFDEALAESGAYIPMRRFGAALEIAKAALFLASDDSSFITGHCLAVDGGNTAQ